MPMPDRIDVSVIIPTYNRLWALPDAVNSCRDARCNTEIIVVDDGSTDGTWEWLQSQKDVRAIRQENGGQCWARNKGMEAAKGEFVRFLNSDDVLLPGAIDLQFEAVCREGADLVAAGYVVRCEGSGTERVSPWVECDDFIAQQIGECDSSHMSAYLFRRSFIVDIPFRQEFSLRDDRIFMIEAALKKPNVTAVSEPTFIHRHHAHERLQFRPGLERAVTHHTQWKLYERAVRTLQAQGELTPRRRKALSNALWPLAHWVTYTDLQDAYRVYDRILEINPDFVPPDPGFLGMLYRRMGFRRTERLLRVRRSLLNL